MAGAADYVSLTDFGEIMHLVGPPNRAGGRGATAMSLFPQVGYLLRCPLLHLLRLDGL